MIGPTIRDARKEHAGLSAARARKLVGEALELLRAPGLPEGHAWRLARALGSSFCDQLDVLASERAAPPQSERPKTALEQG